MIRLFAVVLVLAWSGLAHAQSLKAPSGPVILTVSGKIAQTNRGPFDEKKDAFFKNQQVTFQRAAAFDLAMLEALGMRSVEADYPQGGALHKFEGPLLRDMLNAVGASGRVVKVAALDGYVQEIELREIEQWPILLAVKEDGAYLPLGGFGPTRIVFPRRDVPALADRNDDKWVWAVVHISVE
ncbi:MAG TPA: hypothetical protein VHM01_16780 [Alphaproteobacteria bacterium]|nr:hypothetical protein [Alphaproteobacteria bacterium]